MNVSAIVDCRICTKLHEDLLHLLENTFERKRISANPIRNPITLTLKNNNVFNFILI